MKPYKVVKKVFPQEQCEELITLLREKGTEMESDTYDRVRTVLFLRKLRALNKAISETLRSKVFLPENNPWGVILDQKDRDYDLILIQ